MAARPRHPDKDIEAAVLAAEAAGWTYVASNGHVWGRIKCPAGQRDGCLISVYSTPRNPRGHADYLRRKVASCTYTPPNPPGVAGP